MNPYERHIIHTAIADIEGVRSESKGEGPTRHIVDLLHRSQRIQPAAIVTTPATPVVPAAMAAVAVVMVVVPAVTAAAVPAAAARIAMVVVPAVMAAAPTGGHPFQRAGP